MLQPSIKKVMIAEIVLTGQRVRLLVPGGIISGIKPESEDTELDSMSNQVYRDYQNETSYFGNLEGDDGYFVLEKAVVSVAGSNTQHKRLIVFYDSIIGIAFED